MNLMLYLQRWKNHVFTRNNYKKSRRGKIKIKFPIYSCLELRGITENGQNIIRYCMIIIQQNIQH
jgi:hypothetical protein